METAAAINVSEALSRTDGERDLFLTACLAEVHDALRKLIAGGFPS
jgi:hypothetical protein